MKNTTDMDIEKELELLNDIRKVDASTFLYTRIEQKIFNYQQNFISRKSLAVSFTILSIFIIINISVVIRHFSFPHKSKTEIIVKKYNLYNSNYLYE